MTDPAEHGHEGKEGHHHHGDPKVKIAHFQIKLYRTIKRIKHSTLADEKWSSLKEFIQRANLPGMAAGSIMRLNQAMMTKSAEGMYVCIKW